MVKKNRNQFIQLKVVRSLEVDVVNPPQTIWICFLLENAHVSLFN